MTSRSLIAITSAALLIASCGKKSEPAPAPTAAEPAPPPAPAEDSPAARNQEPPAQANRASAPAPVAAPVAAAPAQVDMSATLGRLTEALRKYSFEHRRVPASLGEVVAAGYVNGMPQAPYGKKFAIDPKQVQVVLVNQ